MGVGRELPQQLGIQSKIHRNKEHKGGDLDIFGCFESWVRHECRERGRETASGEPLWNESDEREKEGRHGQHPERHFGSGDADKVLSPVGQYVLRGTGTQKGGSALMQRLSERGMKLLPVLVGSDGRLGGLPLRRLQRLGSRAQRRRRQPENVKQCFPDVAHIQRLLGKAPRDGAEHIEETEHKASGAGL